MSIIEESVFLQALLKALVGASAGAAFKCACKEPNLKEKLSKY